MTAGKSAGRLKRSAAPPRVGLFGNLGSGNIGNDASMEAVLRYFRSHHPGAILDAIHRPEEAQETAETGRRSVLARYSWDLLAKRLDDVWTSASGVPTRSGRAQRHVTGV